VRLSSPDARSSRKKRCGIGLAAELVASDVVCHAEALDLAVSELSAAHTGPKQCDQTRMSTRDWINHWRRTDSGASPVRSRSSTPPTASIGFNVA